MLYTLSNRIFPAYFEDSFFANSALPYRSTNPILSRSIQALHYHKYLELGICLKGSGTTYVNNRCYRYNEGDMVVNPPGVPHLSASDPGIQSVWTWISLQPLEILESSGIKHIEAFQAMAENSYIGLFHPWEYPRLAELIRRTSETELGDDEHTQLMWVLLSGELLMECARIGDVDHPAEKAVTSTAKVTPALVYIRTNYADNEAMREEQIAKICHMSVSHFRAVFKKETGVTVRDFIIQTRLATAAHLLMSTEFSVLRVAMESGFGQISCFNRIFSREFGETPTAFRKKFRMQIETDFSVNQEI